MKKRHEELVGELGEVKRRAEQLHGDLVVAREERTRLAAELAAEKKAAETRTVEAEQAREQVRVEVQTIALRLLNEKGQAMLTQNKEGLDAALAPVREKMKEFEAKVEKTYDQDSRDRVVLSSQLKHLQDAQERLHKDADNLAKALIGESKTQGDWGELILERVLETAGLTAGREYDLQVSHVDEEGGRKRPDALVYLPDNRAIVVDAKCSITAFVESARAETEEARALAAAVHIHSVRTHVKSLASKNYQDVLKQLEKLDSFLGDMKDVGVKLGAAQKSFDSASNRLSTGRGNVIKKAQAIVQLGARVRVDKVKHLELGSGLDSDDSQVNDEALLAATASAMRSESLDT